MGKVAARHVEGRIREQRVAVRKKLSPLNTLTVQSKTKTRYDSARQGFFASLRQNRLVLYPTLVTTLILLFLSILNIFGPLVKGGPKQMTRWRASRTSTEIERKIAFFLAFAQNMEPQ